MVDNDSLSDGEILTMAELQNAFENIMAENNVDHHSCSRKILKQLIQKEIPGVEFHRPKKVNESERVTIKRTRDKAIQQSEGSNVDLCNDDMKTIFNAAILLTKQAFKLSLKYFQKLIKQLLNLVLAGYEELLRPQFVPVCLTSFNNCLI